MSLTAPHTGNKPSLVKWLAQFRDFGIAGVVLLIALAFGLIQPLFFQPANLFAIIVSISILMVLAVGQMLVIVTKQIDLSVGSALGLSAMVMAMVGRDSPDLPVVVLFMVAVLVGAACGAVNGYLVTAAGVPSIIATLGTMVIFRGLIFIVSDNRQVNPSEIPQGIAALAVTSPVGVPWLVLIALLVAIAGWYLTRKTMVGLRLYAVGSNSDSASARGLHTQRLTFGVFVVMGALAGLGGVLYVSRYATVNPADVGLGLELIVISAVVIGGTNIFGGSGSVIGVVLGCVLVGLLSNGLTVIGVSRFWQSAANGAIILIAVTVDTFVRRQFQRQQAVRRRAK